MGVVVEFMHTGYNGVVNGSCMVIVVGYPASTTIGERHFGEAFSLHVRLRTYAIDGRDSGLALPLGAAVEDGVKRSRKEWS